MTRVVLSPEAQDDSDKIISALARDAGPRVAARYARNFDRLYALLDRHPEIHPLRPQLRGNARMAIISPYLVFHEHDAASGVVTVLRIVHGRRRITLRLIDG